MSEKIKTVIVDIRDADGIGRQVYAADAWDERDGKLAIARTVAPGHVCPVAAYAPGAWLSVRTGDALAPVRDANAVALGIARRALDEIMSALRSGSGSPDETLDQVGEITDSALDQIAGETA